MENRCANIKAGSTFLRRLEFRWPNRNCNRPCTDT